MWHPFEPGRRVSRRGSAQRVDAWEEAADGEAPKQGFAADVHRRHPHQAIYRVQLEIVGADHSPPIDVDQLFVEHIPGEQDFTFSALECIQVDAGRFQPAAFRPQHGHLGPGHEYFSVLDIDYQPGDRRIHLERNPALSIERLESGHDVLYPGDPLTTLRPDGPPEHLRQIKETHLSLYGAPNG
jgi:hypothetical protein